MKRILIVGLILVFGAQLGMTQRRDRRDMQDRRDRLETLRIGFITEELNLSAEEAQKFWPVYNEYEAKMEAIRRERPPKSTEDMSESDAKAWIEGNLQQETASIELRTDYVAKLLEVIPAVKVVRLFEAERKFKLEMIDHMRKRMEQGGPPPKD
jgi:tRNA G37 N-methylase Trm5